jgi:hypothetical protein
MAQLTHRLGLHIDQTKSGRDPAEKRVLEKRDAEATKAKGSVPAQQLELALEKAGVNL